METSRKKTESKASQQQEISEINICYLKFNRKQEVPLNVPSDRL